MKATVAILLFLCGSAAGLDSILLVRHAEKEDGWPAQRELDALHPLSAAGVARAQHLAELLAGEKLLAVYASPTTRSLHTGLPSARAHALEIQVAEGSIRRDQMPDFVASLLEQFPGEGSVLIVGHSNTVPLLLHALGMDPSCDESAGVVEESYGPGIQGYDGIWRVDLAKSGCEAVSWSTQGEAP